MTAGEGGAADRASWRRIVKLIGSSAGIYLGASLLARGASFFLIPLYTRRLSLEDYGEYALAQTLITALPNLLVLGLGAAITRFCFGSGTVADSNLRVGTVARWLATMALAGAFVLQLIVLVLWPSEGEGVAGRWEMSCVIWAAAGAAISGVPAAYLRARQRPLPAAAFQLFEFSANVAAGLTLVAGLDRGLRGAIEASAAAGIANGLIALAFIAFALPGPLDRKVLREALTFSVPFVPHVASNQLQLVSDRWTMKATSMEASLGGYALAGQMASPAFMVLSAWNDAATPQMGEIFRTEGLLGVRKNLPSIVRSYVLAALVPSVMLVAALPIVGLIVGERFAPALWIAPFVCASFVVESVYLPTSNVLFFGDRSRTIPKITIACGLCNVLLNLLLIPWLGVSGAIVARLVSMSARSAAMTFAARACLREVSAPS